FNPEPTATVFCTAAVGSRLNNPSLQSVRFLDNHVSAVGAGDGAADQEQVVLQIDANDLQIAGRHFFVPHAAGHSLPLEDAGGERVHARAAAVAMDFFHAVGGPLPLEVVPPHDARRAAALAGAGHIDGLDLLKQIDLE